MCMLCKYFLSKQEHHVSIRVYSKSILKVYIYFLIMPRYYAIVYPMKAKSVCTVSKAKKVIVLVWLASFIMGMPTLVVQVGVFTKYLYHGHNHNDNMTS